MIDLSDEEKENLQTALTLSALSTPTPRASPSSSSASSAAALTVGASARRRLSPAAAAVNSPPLDADGWQILPLIEDDVEIPGSDPEPSPEPEPE